MSQKGYTSTTPDTFDQQFRAEDERLAKLYGVWNKSFADGDTDPEVRKNNLLYLDALHRWGVLVRTSEYGWK